MDFTKSIDYTTLSSYMGCPRKFLFRHILSLTPDSPPSVDLHFGKCYHTAMETFFTLVKAVQENDVTKDSLTIPLIQEAMKSAFMQEWDSIPHNFDPELVHPKSPSKAFDLINDFVLDNYPNALNHKVIGTEIPFSIPIFDQPNGTEYNYTGRMDAFIMKNNRPTVLEHKTTKYTNQTWSESFRTNLQVEGYLIAAQLSTGITPAVEVIGAHVTKTKHDFITLPITKQALLNERALVELRHIIHNLLDEFDILTQAILEDPSTFLTDRTHPLTYFHRSHISGGQCTAFFRPCEYINLCTSRPNPLTYNLKVPSGFRLDQWNPEDPDNRNLPENHTPKSFLTESLENINN